MAPHSIEAVFGAASWGNRDPFITEDDLKKVEAVLDAHHVTTLDSAQLYGKSEQHLGQTKAGDRYTIDTKWVGGARPGSWTRDNLLASAQESIARLGVKQVDVFYIHAPDPQVPLEETLAGVNDAYQSGLFRRFGLSNYPAKEVQTAYDICKAHNYVLPTVYQGNYNPVARLQETILFPTLRKLNIAFYAYSPIAGGFLTKSPQQIRDGAGRFGEQDIGGLYRRMYMRDSYLQALTAWERIAADEGVPRAELAYRWTASHSALNPELGDKVIVGASNPEQLDQTLSAIEKGRLSDKAAKAIDDIWESIKHEAPVDNFQNFQ